MRLILHCIAVAWKFCLRAQGLQGVTATAVDELCRIALQITDENLHARYRSIHPFHLLPAACPTSVTHLPINVKN